MLSGIVQPGQLVAGCAGELTNALSFKYGLDQSGSEKLRQTGAADAVILGPAEMASEPLSAAATAASEQIASMSTANAQRHRRKQDTAGWPE